MYTLLWKFHYYFIFSYYEESEDYNIKWMINILIQLTIFFSYWNRYFISIQWKRFLIFNSIHIHQFNTFIWYDIWNRMSWYYSIWTKNSAARYIWTNIMAELLFFVFVSFCRTRRVWNSSPLEHETVNLDFRVSSPRRRARNIK